MPEQLRHDAAEPRRQRLRLHVADNTVHEPAEMIVDRRKPVADRELDMVRMVEQFRLREAGGAAGRAQDLEAVELAPVGNTEEEDRCVLPLGLLALLDVRTARTRTLLVNLPEGAVHDRVGAAVPAERQRMSAQERPYEIARPGVRAPGLDFAVGEDHCR